MARRQFHLSWFRYPPNPRSSFLGAPGVPTGVLFQPICLIVHNILGRAGPKSSSGASERVTMAAEQRQHERSGISVSQTRIGGWHNADPRRTAGMEAEQMLPWVNQEVGLTRGDSNHEIVVFSLPADHCRRPASGRRYSQSAKDRPTTGRADELLLPWTPISVSLPRPLL